MFFVVMFSMFFAFVFLHICRIWISLSDEATYFLHLYSLFFSLLFLFCRDFGCSFPNFFRRSPLPSRNPLLVRFFSVTLLFFCFFGQVNCTHLKYVSHGLNSNKLWNGFYCRYDDTIEPNNIGHGYKPFTFDSHWFEVYSFAGIAVSRYICTFFRYTYKLLKIWTFILFEIDCRFDMYTHFSVLFFATQPYFCLPFPAPLVLRWIYRAIAQRQAHANRMTSSCPPNVYFCSALFTFLLSFLCFFDGMYRRFVPQSNVGVSVPEMRIRRKDESESWKHTDKVLFI